MTDSSVKVQASTGTGDPQVATEILPDGTQAQKIELVDASDNKAAISAGGALKVDGSAVTQPVSFAGGVTVNNGTAASAVNIQDGGNSLTVDGTVTANIGTTNGLALDATLTGGGQKTKLVDSGGANIATVTAGGALKIDGSAVTQPVSGTVSINPLPAGSNSIGKVGIDQTTPGTTNGVQLVPGAAGGLTILRVISAATTNATSVKASAGQVYAIYAHNTNAAVRFLKLYDKASAPTVGTDTPVMTLPIPGNTAGAGFVLEAAAGIGFTAGIALAITGAVADSDTTAIGANEVVVNLLFK